MTGVALLSPARPYTRWSLRSAFPILSYLSLKDENSGLSLFLSVCVRDTMATGAEATRIPKTWFITGCSSGFGEILVRKLCAEGENVIATGRQADVKLAHLKDTGAKVMDMDVSASEGVIRETVAQAWATFPGGVDVVVNNAGYVLSGLVEELT